jgi:multidrug efflux system membrane fusion protein
MEILEEPVSGKPVVVLLLFSSFLLSCSGNRTQGPPARPQAAFVTTAVVTRKSVPVDVRVIGNVEAFTTINVKAQVGGQLMEVHFQEGQDVRKGDLLFLIDPRPYDEAIRLAEANLARDQALLRQAEANLQRDLAQEKFARDQAARYQRLFREGVMSREQSEQFAADADARAEAVHADRAAIASAQAAIQGDRAALENVKLQHGYCSIHSPVDGRTGELAIKAGNVVKANDVDLVTIHQVRPINVSFSVPEKELPAVKKYMAAGAMAVLASPAGAPDEVERGALTFIDNSVDSATGTIKLKGTFTNASGKLWPGQFVNVLLRLTTNPNALVTPVKAIQTGQSGEYVYVVKPDMTVESRPVITGDRVDQEVVVAKGLTPGETVVTEGQLRLAPGMRVRLKEAGTL